jgi:hypothetical protein
LTAVGKAKFSHRGTEMKKAKGKSKKVKVQTEQSKLVSAILLLPLTFLLLPSSVSLWLCG